MGDYISREAAIKALSHGDGCGHVCRHSIERIPAADVVEVVRCKDCTYWRGENDLCKGICIDFDADGYCSEGKRKDGGKNDGT